MNVSRCVVYELWTNTMQIQIFRLLFLSLQQTSFNFLHFLIVRFLVLDSVLIVLAFDGLFVLLDDGQVHKVHIFSSNHKHNKRKNSNTMCFPSSDKIGIVCERRVRQWCHKNYYMYFSVSYFLVRPFRNRLSQLEWQTKRPRYALWFRKIFADDKIDFGSNTQWGPEKRIDSCVGHLKDEREIHRQRTMTSYTW